MKKYKILFILHYPPPVHGAAVVGQYIKESKFINNEFQSKYFNLSTSVSIEDIGKQGLKKWFRYFGLVIRFIITGLFWRPNLVYITLTSHGLGLWKDSIIVVLCRLLRLKHVFHFHNKGVSNYVKKNKRANKLYRFVFKKANVILLSPLLYPDISNYISVNKVMYCANGIPKYPNTIIQNNIDNNSIIKLLFLSNLIESKGLWDLLDACKILLDKNINFTCDIIGGEGDISMVALENRINLLSLHDKVKYLGKKYGEEKFNAFSNSKIFIHPTHDDCFPLVLLEAMQYGLPVISTYEGAIPKIVENNKTGFLVEKKNPEELAYKIEFLINNQDLRIKMGVTGKEKFNNQFTLEIFENNLTTILKNLNNK